MVASAEILRRSAAHVLVDDLADPQLSDRAAHHLLRVRRLRDDETVTITDGQGRWRTARLVRSGLSALGEVVEEQASLHRLELLVAVPKQDRPEWIVQKATELGIDRIVLLHADRSVVRWEPDRAAKHLARLRTVATEALMQSRRTFLPEIAGPIPAAAAFSERVSGRGAGPVVVADPGGRPLGPHDHRVAVGPEGGWSAEELALAPATVSLGANVLRVETAALAACVLMQALRTER